MYFAIKMNDKILLDTIHTTHFGCIYLFMSSDDQEYDVNDDKYKIDFEKLDGYKCVDVTVLEGTMDEVLNPRLSKRDQLAGMAMQGILANEAMYNDMTKVLSDEGATIPHIASGAYRYADAMIEEGNKS